MEQLGKKSISISEKLYKKIKDRVEGTGFESVEEYVDYVLREIVTEDEEEEEFSEEDEEKVRERLRALGYMD